MERRRKQLDATFRSILGNGNVYFQPPTSVTLKYPAIVYRLNRIKPSHADNGVYVTMPSYTVTVIDPSPKGVIAEKVAMLPSCIHTSSFKKDNLNQDTFTIY